MSYIFVVHLEMISNMSHIHAVKESVNTQLEMPKSVIFAYNHEQMCLSI